MEENLIGLIDGIQRKFNLDVREMARVKDEAIENLMKSYAEEHAKYKIGDFVGNATGIIKVDRVFTHVYGRKFVIIYEGLRYYKRNGVMKKRKKEEVMDYLEGYVKKHRQS